MASDCPDSEDCVKEVGLHNDIHSNGNGGLRANLSEQTQLIQSNYSNERLDVSNRTMGTDHEEYAVEKLLREKPGDPRSLIEVKWKGWASEDKTWEERSQLLEDVPDMVAEFDSRLRSDSQILLDRVQSKPKDLDGNMSAQTSTTEDISIANSRLNPRTAINHSNHHLDRLGGARKRPLIFSTLLREWGVQGVSVREVIPLDAVFDTPVASTLGLIFLSRYVVFDQGTTACIAPPPDTSTLWFANQISSFSCATVALMNIINNRPDLHLGPELQAFKTSTATLSPKDRGLALDGLAPVRAVHNSFATEADKLYVDVRLKDEVKAAHSKTLAQNRRRKGRRKKTRELVGEDDESGLHFVAFVPSDTHLWRLDGLEREPTCIGRIGEKENWLMMVVPVLETQFNQAAMDELEFSLLGVVLTGEKTEGRDAERMRRVREDWGPLMATSVRLHAEKGDLAARLG